VILPGLALPDIPSGAHHLKERGQLAPGRPSFVRTVRSPDGRFDPTRCRFLYPSWHRKPSGGRFADLANDPPDRANPHHRAPGTQLSNKQPVGSCAVASASRRLANRQPIPSRRLRRTCSFTESIELALRIRASLERCPKSSVFSRPFRGCRFEFGLVQQSASSNCKTNL